MKQIITLFFVLATISFSFAQSSANITAKKQKQEVKIKSIDRSYETRSAADCIFTSDFSDPSKWVLDHDDSDCSLDWVIGENLECTGFFPISPIVSENGFYALLDSDNYGGEEGGTEVEDSWLTTADPVDLSGVADVVVQFDTYYQSFTSEKCFLVVSTDGTFPSDLSPDTDASTIPGVYEIFPSISGNAQGNTDNPETVSINISDTAGDQSEVWIRFNWTGTWGYAWFIDNVCITEQPANDIELAYGVVSHNGTGEEYGRVPTAQIANSEISYEALVYNFGTSTQEDVSMTLEVVEFEGFDADNNPLYGDSDVYTSFGDNNSYGQQNTEGLWDLTLPAYGPLASDGYRYFDMMVDASAMGPDNYIAYFSAGSEGDYLGGEYDYDNYAARQFAITTNEYSTDGVDVYYDYEVTRIGTASFEGGADGFMMFSYYDVTSATEVTGARILFDSYIYTDPGTVPGGEIIVSLRDTASVFAETFDPFNGVIAETDFIYLGEDAINNGYIDVTFDQPVSVSPNAYFLAVEMYSNANDSDIYIIDDETVPQPGQLAMIYIPGDAVYSNGDAAAIRMLTSDENIVSLDDEELSGLSIYPNPSNGILNVDVSKNDNYSVQISDIIGKVIVDDKITSSTTFDLKHLDGGVYFVNISNNEISKTEKIVIEK
jgi:hypothetical protein